MPGNRNEMENIYSHFPEVTHTLVEHKKTNTPGIYERGWCEYV